MKKISLSVKMLLMALVFNVSVSCCSELTDKEKQGIRTLFDRAFLKCTKDFPPVDDMLSCMFA